MKIRRMFGGRFAAPAGEDFWLDYVADLGDGWNPTYAVAQAVAQPALEVADAAGHLHSTRGGDVLVAADGSLIRVIAAPSCVMKP
jgi:hypothetical protein